MKNLLVLLAILITAAYMRSYTISAGMPYFYDEDEAHHFNRTANMAKSGDMNPHYFHKPSLHFYLRIPVIWLSSYIAEKKGHFKEINEIRTYNKYGIAGYAFTASHPGIVKAVRALSLLFSLTIILLTYLIARKVSGSDTCALLSAAATAICPPLISYSSVIGVDTLMTMMCLLAVYFSLIYSETQKNTYLILSCVFSGLAVSSKYNALPVCAVPLITCFLNKELTKKNLVSCLLIPVLSFFAASPYILTSLPDFIDDLSYEIWHYSTAGHVGHSAAPGIGQIIFYSKWFYSQALGPAFTLTALFGLILLCMRRNKADIVFLTLPLLYFLMMILQKANFVRNMLVILPFLLIFSSYAVFKFLSFLNIKSYKLKLFSLIIFTLCAIQPFNTYIKEKNDITGRTESRRELTDWILKDTSNTETAVSGSLQLIPQIPITLKNYTTFDEKTSSPLSLWLDGYDRVMVSPAHTGNFNGLDYLTLEKSFSGNRDPLRIIENPEVNVFRFNTDKITKDLIIKEISDCTQCNIRCVKTDLKYDCESSEKGSTENLKWIQKRVTAIELTGISEYFKNKDEITLTINLMGPWENKIGIFDSKDKLINIPAAGTPYSVSLKLNSNQLFEKDKILFYTENIKSPFKQKISDDKRKLGAAITILLPSDLT